MEIFPQQRSQQRQKPDIRTGVKTSTPDVPEMRQFEENVAKMLENIEFRNTTNEFITRLENDKQKIKSSPNVFVFDEKPLRNGRQILQQTTDAKHHKDL